MYDPTEPVPAWDDSLREIWSVDITETGQFFYPIDSLVSWRWNYDLE